MSTLPYTDHTPIKRRRGGQPGNQNAKNNSGNPRPHRNTSVNRGGAPLGNSNACKRRSLATELEREYANRPDAVAWLMSNREMLAAIPAQSDAPCESWLGLTPEALAATGREYDLGLYSLHPVETAPT